MGDYFALIGNRLLHSENGDTHCKLALQLILNGYHKDGSRMLCQYLETAVDVAVNQWLPDDATYDEKFCASLFPAVAPLYSKLGKSFLSTSTCNEMQWSLLCTSCESDKESIPEIHEYAFQNLEKARVVIAGIALRLSTPFTDDAVISPDFNQDEVELPTASTQIPIILFKRNETPNAPV